MDQNTPTDLEKVINWIEESFEVKASPSIVSRFLKNHGLTPQLVGRRGAKAVSFDNYAFGYHSQLLELRELDFFNFDPSRIITLDFITKSYRLDRQTTIALSGSKQQKFEKIKPTYTSSYLVPAAMGAGIDLKAMMFTFDPVFKRDGPHAAKVQGWCDKPW